MTNPFKNAIRNACRDVRKQLPQTFQKQIASQICSKIKSLNQYRYAKRIALYHAFNGEVDLSEIWRSAPLQGKFCYFPALTENRKLLFLPATPSTPFKTNQYGIPEPDVALSEALPPKELDLIFMPLVAFDKKGTRLGMGSGYYDRTLAQENHPLLIGVAYEFQQQHHLEVNEWDVPMTAIITEKTIYWV